jgi:N-acetylmuramoyl-L-alanine amidase
MARLSETKASLLRDVVQDNINVVHGVRVIRAKRRSIRIRGWLWSSLLVLGIAYLTVAAQVVSRGSAPAKNTQLGAPTSTALSIEQTPEAEVPLEHPRPIDRNAIPLSIKTIVIDAGHGGDPGAISESGLTEKEITLDVALRLRRILSGAPFQVLLTRDSDRRLSLDKRVRFANENKADLFLSIHVNSMEPHTLRALETYYVGPTDDPATLKLASRENKESDYSLSDYKQILEKIYVDARRDESRTVAKTVQSALFQSLKTANPRLENRGVRTAPFVVLIGTQMPAVLVEIACLSNPDEVELLTKENYRESIALALAQGIRRYANGLTMTATKGS